MIFILGGRFDDGAAEPPIQRQPDGEETEEVRPDVSRRKSHLGKVRSLTLLYECSVALHNKDGS